MDATPLYFAEGQFQTVLGIAIGVTVMLSPHHIKAADKSFEISFPEAYSCVMEVQPKAHSSLISMPIFVSKNRTRVEMSSPAMPELPDMGKRSGHRSPKTDIWPMVTIFLLDQGKQIMMLSAKKVAAQEDIQPAVLKKLKESQQIRYQVDPTKSEGEATMDGHPCMKYRIPSLSHPGEEEVVYLAQDLGQFPVRIDTSRSIIIYRSVKIGPVDEAVFRIPADYRQEASLSIMFQNSLKTKGVGREIAESIGKVIISSVISGAAGAAGGFVGGAIGKP